MSLKFLVDVGVGRAVEDALRSHCYDMKAVRDSNPRATDTDILEVAVSEGRMVLTMDKDFGELVHKQSLPHSGVLILRMEDARSAEKVAVVLEILSTYEHEIAGMFCVYQDGRLRVRP
jgi:predicted nuclease of predicted toxin-antitoxin system